MLISFSVENYRSFADEQTLSLEAVKDDAHPDHVVDCGRFALLKTAALYGANASGKSNLLKAFSFMERFVRSSATRMTLGDPIRGADSFRLDKTRGGMPCSFDIRVSIEDTEYQYGFSATRERVHDEWLYVTRRGTRATNPLSRNFDSSTGRTEWTLRGELKGAGDVTEKTRENGLFLSRAAEMNVESVKEVFLWFKNRVRYIDNSSLPQMLVQRTARRMDKDAAFSARVEKLMRDADVGIDHLLARKVSNLSDLKDASAEDRTFIDSLTELLESRLAEDEGTVRRQYLETFAVQTLHSLPDSGETVVFSLEDDESKGTQRFFGIIGPVLHALDEGNLLVVDELDCSMHPHLTYKLVEMFQSAETNPNGAQLVFATHDTNLMTPELFRRDEIWLTEKAAGGGTQLFSLADIKSKPRKDEVFEKHYLAGRYGGVPSFGPALESF
jgi:AAA15 family ATPase/GTPase